MDIVTRMRDNRTETKLKFDFQRNVYIRERQVMLALAAEYAGRGVLETNFEKVDESEAVGSLKGFAKPDYFFYVNNKTFTYEIKYNNADSFHDHDGVETVYIKPGSIYAMLNDAYWYPNGHLIIATKRKFCIMTAYKVSQYELGIAYQYSTDGNQKKAFLLPADDLDWKMWMTPIADMEPRRRW